MLGSWSLPRLPRRASVALVALSLAALAVTPGAAVEAKPGADVTTVVSSVRGSDGKNYSITNHLRRDTLAGLHRGPAREWLLTWAGDDSPGGADPDPDFLAVIDATRGAPTYGDVVNTVTVDSLFGNEPHHMQYVWHKGHKVFAAGIFSDTTFVFDVAALPEVRLSGIVLPADTPCGSAPDAYAVLRDGTAYGTYMGGPDVSGPCRYTNGEVRTGNGFAGSPGEVVRIDGRGRVLAEAPAATLRAEDGGNCLNLPALPLVTCANPHGVAVREDLNRMVTSDFAEVRNMLNPTAPPPAGVGRPTVRIFDIAERNDPRLLSMSYLPDGPRVATDPFGIGEEPNMVMETAVTHKRHHRGAFASTMSGGAIYYTPDITAPQPQWREVFDDYTAFSALFPTKTPRADTDGGSWLMVSPDDRFLYHVVLQGGVHSDPEHQSAGLVYVLDIRKLLAAGNRATCSIDTVAETSAGGAEADCPALVSVLPINDTSSGGPHWAAMDNFASSGPGHYRETEQIRRLAVSNYFVKDTYIDGNHLVCMIDVSGAGQLSMDETFRDETTDAPCVDFNRTRWPHGERGAARPHGVLFAVADAQLR